MQTEKRLEIQFQYLIDLKSYTDHVWTSRIEVHARERSRLGPRSSLSPLFTRWSWISAKIVSLWRQNDVYKT